MFDITSSKLLLLGIVALLVIGPKDFPALLRAIGKYVGIIRGHAKEFRAQFDEAMRESELADLKKDVEKIAQETEASLSDVGQSVEKSVDEARRSVDASLDTAPALDPLAHLDADGLPIAPPQPAPAIEAASATNGAADALEQAASTGGDTAAAAPPAPAAAPAVEKSGA
jgi:sec-independent protein translocase protein TatB